MQKAVLPERNDFLTNTSTGPSAGNENILRSLYFFYFFPDFAFDLFSQFGVIN